MVPRYGRATLVYRGWNPLNRATLDNPEILASASDDVQAERALVLGSRGTASNVGAYVPPNQMNLLETGSGCLAGGVAVRQELAQTIGSLNFNGSTASDLFSLAQITHNRDNGRRDHMAEDAAAQNQLTREELMRRYKEASRFTAGTVFGIGDGMLGPEVRDEVIRCNQARDARTATVTANKKATSRKLCAECKEATGRNEKIRI